jgi:uncharacterized protein (TIGR00645 family)
MRKVEKVVKEKNVEVELEDIVENKFAKFSNFLESLSEIVLFGGRWLLAPLYLGLLFGLIPILYRFFFEFFELYRHMTSLNMHQLTLSVLEMLDTVLLGNLVIIVIFAGYENFVSKINVAENSEDRPHWMGRVDYSGLKIKLIGSLVAISVIELLKDFMQDTAFDTHREIWRVGIHLTFVISGVLFALMDFIADKREQLEVQIDREIIQEKAFEKQQEK